MEEARIVIKIDSVPYGEASLRASRVIALPVSLDHGWYVASWPELNMELCEQTMENLVRSFHEDIRMLWEDYAMADDSALTPLAIQLKRSLLASFSLIGEGEAATH